MVQIAPESQAGQKLCGRSGDTPHDLGDAFDRSAASGAAQLDLDLLALNERGTHRQPGAGLGNIEQGYSHIRPQSQWVRAASDPDSALACSPG